MTVRLFIVLVSGLLAGVLLAGLALRSASAPAPVPVGGLHSVWCVDRGYPADLAMPLVVGPGTGLTGCPLGEVQVQEP